MWDEVSERGYAFDTLGLRAPDPHGTLLVEMQDARTGGPDLPATVGMYRPDLAAVLHRRAAAARREGPAGPHRDRARSRTTTASTVTFADGDTGRYDLVVGADGVRSVDPLRSSGSPSTPGRPGWASGARSPSARPA